jgi:hypothetical protein
MAAYEFGSKEFDDAVRATGRQAFLDTLAAGLSVFYISKGLNIMEQPMAGDSRSAGVRTPRPVKKTTK